MASITNRPNGHKWVHFTLDGKRKTLRLGLVDGDFAVIVKHHAERLVASLTIGVSVPLATAGWVRDSTPELRDKLRAVGLLESRRGPAKLEKMLEYCRSMYADKKDNTRRNLDRAADLLVEKFGADTDIADFTIGDAQEFRSWLTSKGYAKTTVSEHCLKARRLFKMAVDKEWLTRNPFGKMKGFTRSNSARHFFVERSSIQRVIDKCCNQLPGSVG